MLVLANNNINILNEHIMNDYIDILIKSEVFSNINKDEIVNILEDLKVEKKSFKKSNIIIDTGDIIENIYIILKGKVEISKEYDDTRKNIVNILTQGDIFAEAFAFSTNKVSSIQALALENTELIKINIQNIFKANDNNIKNMFLHNLLRVISDKNKFLAFKNDILSQKSLRSKIIIYIKYMENIQKSKNIIIPSADRSALSRELNRLSKENIIELDGNRISIINIKN